MAKNNLAINTGLGKIAYSILDEKTGEYGIPKEINELVSIAINPNEDSQTFYAGDREVIVTSKVNVEMTFGVPAMSNECMCDLFGYSMGTKGELIYSSKVERPRVALLFTQNNYGEVTDYVTLWECRLNLSETSGTTQKESVEFGSKEFSAKVMIPADGIYMSVASSDETDFTEEYATGFFTVKPVKPVKKQSLPA